MPKPCGWGVAGPGAVGAAAPTTPWPRPSGARRPLAGGRLGPLVGLGGQSRKLTAVHPAGAAVAAGRASGSRPQHRPVLRPSAARAAVAAGLGRGADARPARVSNIAPSCSLGVVPALARAPGPGCAGAARPTPSMFIAPGGAETPAVHLKQRRLARAPGLRGRQLACVASSLRKGPLCIVRQCFSCRPSIGGRAACACVVVPPLPTELPTTTKSSQRPTLRPQLAQKLEDDTGRAATPTFPAHTRPAGRYAQRSSRRE